MFEFALESRKDLAEDRHSIWIQKLYRQAKSSKNLSHQSDGGLPRLPIASPDGIPLSFIAL